MFPRLVEFPALFVQAAQIELDRRAVGRRLDEILIRLDRLVGVVRNPVVVRRNQVLFLCRQRVGQVHGAARGLHGLVVVSQRRVRSPERRIGEREVAVLLGGRVEALARFLMRALLRELHAFAVQAHRLKRAR